MKHESKFAKWFMHEINKIDISEEALAGILKEKGIIAEKFLEELNKVGCQENQPPIKKGIDLAYLKAIDEILNSNKKNTDSIDVWGIYRSLLD